MSSSDGVGAAPAVKPLGGGFPLQGYRPTSGARTPRRPTSARTPRAREAAEAVTDDKPWLFGIDRALTTADIAAMGFCRALVFDADEWVTDEIAAEVISDAFLLAPPLPRLSGESRSALTEAMRHSFTGGVSGGDVLVVIRSERLIDLEEGSPEAVACYTCVGRVVDAISAAWEAANADGDPTLAAVIVVLESFPKRRVEVEWGPDSDGPEPRAHAVVALDDDLANFFEG